MKVRVSMFWKQVVHAILEDENFQFIANVIVEKRSTCHIPAPNNPTCFKESTVDILRELLLYRHVQVNYNETTPLHPL